MAYNDESWVSAHDEDPLDMQSEGLNAGRRWAEDPRSARQLERLVDLRKSMSDDEWEWASEGAGSGFSFSENLFFIMEPDLVGSRADSNEFWSQFVEHGIEADTPFVIAFVEGAMEVWYRHEG